MAKHIRTYNCTLIGKLKELNDFLAHKPQDLVFYAFRQRAFAYFWKTNPMGLSINLWSEAALTLHVNTALPKD